MTNAILTVTTLLHDDAGRTVERLPTGRLTVWLKEGRSQTPQFSGWRPGLGDLWCKEALYPGYTVVHRLLLPSQFLA